MPITVKSKKEIEIMREGGKIAARILKLLANTVKPGVTTQELDDIATREILQAGAQPSFLGHAGFPAAICTSVNDEIVHGIPSGRVLKEGDIIGIDLGVYYKDFHSDTTVTVPVGKVSSQAQKLITVTRKSLEVGIKALKPGIHLGDVQSKIQKAIEENGFGVIRDLTGHGIGRDLQEEPSIPNYGKPGEGPVLQEGMVLAIEPMVSEGDWHVKINKDGWTVMIADGSLGAHFEHTIAITQSGSEVLTLE